MSFNRIVKTSLAVLTALSLSACGLFHDEPKTSAFSSSMDLSCLKEAPAQAQNLFAGNYGGSDWDQQQEKALWKCLDHALDIFSKYARGADPSCYSAKELQNFANRFLPKNKPLNDEFVKSIFMMKAAIVGGDKIRLTQSEILILRAKLSQFGDIITPLSPYIGTLLTSSSQDTSSFKVDARASLKTFGSRVADFFSTSANNLVWGDVTQFINLLESYIGNDKHLFSNAVGTVQSVTPFLIGKAGDGLTPNDTRQLINKGVSLYLLWTSADANKNVVNSVGASVEIVLAPPTFYALTHDQFHEAIDNLQNLLAQIAPDVSIDWDLYRKYVDEGFELKSIIYSDPDSALSNADLTKLAAVLAPFRTNDSLDIKFATLSLTLQKQALAPIRIADLVPIVDSVLPSDKSIESYGLTTKLICDIKGVLIGGDPDTISSKDYQKITKGISLFYSNIKPAVDALPEGFKPGINADTMTLAQSLVSTLISFSGEPISMPALKTLLSDYFATSKFHVRDSTLNTLLIGVGTRVFNQSKLAKPATLDGMTIDSSQFIKIATLLDKLALDLREVETVYNGLDNVSTTYDRDALLHLLNRSTNQAVVATLRPILNGQTQAIQFPADGQPNTQYYEYDVVNKAFNYDVVNFLFPLYQVEGDLNLPKGQLPRLSYGDLVDLLTDANPLLYDLEIVFSDDPAPHSASARMTTVNLLTQVANGDAYADPMEATEFLTINTGTHKSLVQIENTLFPICNPGMKIRDIKSISYKCLTENFFTKDNLKAIYGTAAPRLISEYSIWNDQKRDDFRKAALSSTFAGWTENGALDISYFQNLASLPFFLENVFERFDVDNDDVVNYGEVMAGFPVFCAQIKTVGGSILKREDCSLSGKAPLTEAIYGYLVFKQKTPAPIKGPLIKEISAIADLVGWFAKWELMNKSPSKRDTAPPQLDRNDLIRIISNLAGAIQ